IVNTMTELGGLDAARVPDHKGAATGRLLARWACQPGPGEAYRQKCGAYGCGSGNVGPSRYNDATDNLHQIPAEPTDLLAVIVIGEHGIGSQQHAKCSDGASTH